MKNEKALLDGLMKNYKNSVLSIFTKFNGAIKNGKAKVSETTEPKKDSGNTMFLESLKAIGRPAMTKEIVSRFKKNHPELKSIRNKKTFRQQFYNSASALSKEGIISRSLVGKNSYEYSMV